MDSSGDFPKVSLSDIQYKFLDIFNGSVTLV